MAEPLIVVLPPCLPLSEGQHGFLVLCQPCGEFWLLERQNCDEAVPSFRPIRQRRGDSLCGETSYNDGASSPSLTWRRKDSCRLPGSRDRRSTKSPAQILSLTFGGTRENSCIAVDTNLCGPAVSLLTAASADVHDCHLVQL